MNTISNTQIAPLQMVTPEGFVAGRPAPLPAPGSPALPGSNPPPPVVAPTAPSPPRKVAVFLRIILPCERRVLDQCLITDRVKAIADVLDLSENTVEAYRKRLLKKWRLLYPRFTKGKKAFSQMIHALLPWLITPPEQKSTENSSDGPRTTV